MRPFFKAIVDYLKDWKNLLSHSLIGIGLVLVAIFLPVPPLARIGILVLAVTLNVLRMRLEKRNAAGKAD